VAVDVWRGIHSSGRRVSTGSTSEVVVFAVSRTDLQGAPTPVVELVETS